LPSRRPIRLAIHFPQVRYSGWEACGFIRLPPSVSELALSPDGKVIVSVGEQLIAWETETGKELWRAEPAELGFHFSQTGYGGAKIAFSADGTHFYTSGGKNDVLIWTTRSGAHDALSIADLPKPKLPSARNSGITSIDVTADDKWLAVGSAGCIAVCNGQGELFAVIENTFDGPPKIDNNDRLTFTGDYSYGRFSPDDKLLAVVMSGRPEQLRLCEVPSGRELRTIQLGARLVRLAFSPDGKRIAATERDSAVRLYDVESGERLWSQVVKLNDPRENYTSAVAFSPDGRMIAVGATDNAIYLFAPSTGEQIERFATGWYPWAFAFTADSKVLYSSGWDGEIRRWDMASRKQLELPAGRRGSGVVAASPDGHLLAYADASETIRLVDAKSGAERRAIKLAGTSYSHLAFSPDGRQLAGAGSSRDNVHVAVWTVADGALVHRWNWPKGRDPHSSAECPRFSPDGSRLAVNVFRQSAAYLWDLTSGQQIAELPHKEVYGLSFSPDGKTLATAGWDSIVRFWDGRTGSLLREFSVAEGGAVGDDLRMYAVRYAPHGGLIATAHLDGTVRLWQADNMLLRTQFSVRGRFVFDAMEFSPDGLWLATGSMDGHVQLWDPLTGGNVWTRGRHQGIVYTVSFGRDSQTLATGGSEEGVCYLWDLRPGDDDPHADLNQLWEQLAGDDSFAAYRAMWALAQRGEESTVFLAEKLRPFRSLVDPNHIAKDDSAEERQRAKQLKKLLAAKDPKVALEIAARRAMSVLAQIGTPEATALLQELVDRDPTGEVARVAADALARLVIGGP
jgi:WD40 repeat protein